MGDLIVDIADMKAGKNSGKLVTYALGSCIGVAAYDPNAHAGALLHYMLPESKLDPIKAKDKPFMFADTGLLMMFQTLKTMGCTSKSLIVKAAGGANIMDTKGTFNIGKRNMLALKKLLWKYNIAIKAHDTGGNKSRTMTLDIASGNVSIKYPGQKEETLL